MDSFNGPLGLIFGRRSVRVYAPGEVTEAQIQRLLEAAMSAPSAMSRDPWRFVVIRDRKNLVTLSQALPGGGMLATASASVVICGDLDVTFEHHPGYLAQDCSAATQNLLLAAHGLGLGACWVGIYPSEPSIKQVRTMLRLPGSFIPLAAISLGIPGENPEPRTRYKAQHVRHETW